MFKNEIFLRTEIDRLEAEVLWLKMQLAELKDEMAELKGKDEYKKVEDFKGTKAVPEQVR